MTMSRVAEEIPADRSLAAASGHAAARLADPGYLLRFALVTAVYVGAAKVGLGLPVAHGVITPVWAPSGIALAALIILGPRFWPAVALGAFIANATSAVPMWIAAAIAVGNTLEAVCGAFLLRRAGFRRSLDRARDVLAFVLLAAVVSTTISATVGVTTLWLDGRLSDSYGSGWALWWSGDAMGDLLVAPMLLVWSVQRRRRVRRGELLEAAALLLGLVGISLVVFVAGLWRYPYLLFPLLIWAALRFRQLGAATATFVASAIAVAGAVGGTVPLASQTLTHEVQILQALFSAIAVTLLLLGATLTERQRAEEEVALAHAGLAAAQEVAHLGSWEWDIERGRVRWSDELYRMYGFEPQSVQVSFDWYLERVHRDDRQRVRRRIAQARSDGRPFSFEHRTVLPDGSVRTLRARGEALLDDAGRARRMVGTAQDVTEQQLLDALRNDILSAVSHELRTPLASILGFALTLKNRGASMSDPVVREIVDHLSEQATRLERLLSDLLDLDRFRRGLAYASRRETPVDRLVERVVLTQSDDRHEFVVDAEPIVADIDGPKVERIVDNLLANAVKYTPRGSRIKVRVVGEAGGVLIAVDDEGPGIPDDVKESIFELFERGVDVSSYVSGTGIGLSLVSQFARLHGGRAWVEDNAAGGASFRVHLPAR
jgi:PAS domain S-box-containing protein